MLEELAPSALTDVPSLPASLLSRLAALLQVHDVLLQYYKRWYAAFLYYAGGGSGDPFHMPLNAWTNFLDDCQVWRCGIVTGAEGAFASLAVASFKHMAVLKYTSCSWC